MRVSFPIDHRRKNGSAVIVLMALLSLMVMFVFANLKTLSYLSRELKLVEKRQIERLKKSSGTNATVVVGVQQTTPPGVAIAAPSQQEQESARN